MVVPQSPSLAVVIPAQAMLSRDMPTQGLGPVAAIEANHVFVANRLPHRHSRSEDFLGLIWPSKLRKRSVYRCDEFRNLTGSDCMMLDITPDDFAR
jgi:hypothetical protein